MSSTPLDFKSFNMDSQYFEVSFSPEIAQSFRDLLDIPAEFDPVTIIPLGYPAVEPPVKLIPHLSEVISYETFSKK